MAPTPSKIKFQMITFDEISDSLWALDFKDRVFHYNMGIWKLIDQKMMIHLSAGRNGIFGIGIDNLLYQRDGITSSNTAGIAWSIVLKGNTSCMLIAMEDYVYLCIASTDACMYG